MRNPLAAVFRWTATLLARLDLIDEDRGKRTAELAWPRILTGFARLSQRTADLAMIGFAVGPPGIAGIAFATVFWQLGNSLSLGLTSGTINQVSQRFGADRPDRLDLAVKVSVVAGIVIGAPFTIVYWFTAERLIELVASDTATLGHGTAYLRFLGLAMVPNFLNTIASRSLAGADDTRIPMLVRSAGALLNIVLNAVLIFGLGLGVTGAALGTVVAEGLVTVAFVWGFLTGSLPFVGSLPLQVRPSPPYIDWRLLHQLFEIATPLMARRLAERVVWLPLFAILATFGPTVVAAYEVARRVRNQMNAPGWGFSISASSLVGQALGADDEQGASAYAWDVITFSVIVYAVSAGLVIVLARPITLLFVREPAAVAVTVPFVAVSAASLFGLGIDSTVTGVLKATGDTRWPLYGKFIGLYLFVLPIAYIGSTGTGVVALYVALVAETAVPAAVGFYRFRTGRWKAISRAYRPETSG